MKSCYQHVTHLPQYHSKPTAYLQFVEPCKDGGVVPWARFTYTVPSPISHPGIYRKYGVTGISCIDNYKCLSHHKHNAVKSNQRRRKAEAGMTQHTKPKHTQKSIPKHNEMKDDNACYEKDLNRLNNTLRNTGVPPRGPLGNPRFSPRKQKARDAKDKRRRSQNHRNAAKRGKRSWIASLIRKAEWNVRRRTMRRKKCWNKSHSTTLEKSPLSMWAGHAVRVNHHSHRNGANR